MAALNQEVRGWQADQELFDAAMAELAGLNRTDWRCLDLIGTRGSMTAGELAEAARLTTGAITGVLDHLEAAGVVRRVRDTADRRRVIIEMTADAQRRALEAYSPFLQDSDRLMSLFDADQVAAIVDFVRRKRVLLETHTARVREQLADRDRHQLSPAALHAKLRSPR